MTQGRGWRAAWARLAMGLVALATARCAASPPRASEPVTVAPDVDAVGPALAAADAGGDAADDPVVARVGPREIRWHEALDYVPAIAWSLRAQAEPRDPAVRERWLQELTIEALVNHAIFDLEAERLGIRVTPEDVQRRQEEEAASLGRSADAAAAALLAEGLSHEHHHEILRTALERDAILEQVYRDELTARDDEVSAVYQALPRHDQSLEALAPRIREALRRARASCLNTNWLVAQHEAYHVEFLAERRVVAPLHAEVPADARVPVAQVEITGNTALTADEVRHLLAGDDPRGVPLGPDGRPSEAALRAVRLGYFDRGYLGAQARGEPLEGSVCVAARGHVRVAVDESVRYRVRALTARERRGSELMPLGRAGRAARLGTRVGDWFALSTSRADVVALQTAYRNAGYAFAEVAPGIETPSPGVVDVSLTVTPGERATVERVDVRGQSDRWSEADVRRLVAVRVDRPYSEAGLERARAALRRTAGLERATVSTERVEGHSDRVVVVVTLPPRDAAAAPPAPAG